MLDWNVVATTQEHRFRQARDLLSSYGKVQKSGFFNVLVMQVENAIDFIEALTASLQDAPDKGACLSRVIPATVTFLFQSPDEFEAKAKQAVEPWVSDIAGKTFHIRMHRRGFHGRISSQHEEQFLDHFLLQRLEERGKVAKIDFADPDFIIALETVGQRAGLSLWSRDELQRYPLLRLD